MSELSNLLRNAKGEASYDAIASKARRAGFPLSPSAVAKFIRDEHKGRTRDETLQALAAGFDLDVRLVREAAGRQRGELGPYVPDSRANSLTKDQREALDRLIVTIVEQGGTSWGAGKPSGPEDDDGGPSAVDKRRLTMVEPADEADEAESVDLRDPANNPYLGGKAAHTPKRKK